ncbi:MAG: leucine-rich repeat protein [Clostridia bacterium]|nr:leucine-rich repeat protein [Clostridia bacterium]
MSKKIKLLSLSVVLIAMMSMLTTLVAVADYSGTDSGINWTFDTSEGTLTVSGNGTMAEYEHGTAPWYEYKSNIKSIVVSSGVTVSKGAFYGMEALESITVPYVGDGSSNTYFGYIFGADNYYLNVDFVPASLKTVKVSGSTQIASYAFNSVSGIKKVILADTVATINSYAFKDCGSLETVVLGSGTSSVAANAFYRCTALETVFFNGTTTGWSAVTVDSTNAITPICLADASLSVKAPTKTSYSLGEKLDLTGLKVTFGSNDVTSKVEIVKPDMTSMGTKTVTVIYGTKTKSFNVTVSTTGISNVSGGLTWSLNTSTGALTISGKGMMDNYTLETLAPWYIYRDSIKTVTVNSGVTSVGAYAFYGLEKVTSITLPSTVEAVDYAAFELCSALSSITLGNTSAVVDGTAFRSCISLPTTTVNGATYLTVSGNQYYALMSVDPSVTSFTINANTVVIAEGAFDGSALTSITVPNKVISIGDNAFASSTSLVSVTLGTGVKHIGNYAFLDCSSLETLTLNAVPDYVGAGAFSATALTGTASNGAVYLGAAGNDYAILWKAEGDGVTSCTLNANTKVIASLAFAGCSSLEAVQLPAGLLHIGDSAFNACTSLYSVTLPDSLLTIGDAAFKDTSALTSVTFGKSLEVIGNSAFRGASSLKQVIIGDGVENVGYNAFRDCTSLEALAYNAKGIGYKAFANCTNLTSVYLADTVLSLGEYAFAGCFELTSIAIPDTTASIGFGALYDCDAITDLSLPFAGAYANDSDNGISYVFGNLVPASYNMLLIGSSIYSETLNGVSSVETLIIDKTAQSVDASAFNGITVGTAYYMGSESEWNSTGAGSSLANISFADSTFTLVSNNNYSVGDLLDRAKFTATVGTTDVTSILRFTANPIVSEELLLPAKIGSVEVLFKSKLMTDVKFTNYSLLLEGSIGVKFYVKLGDYVIENIDKVNATIDYLGEEYPVELVKATNTVDGAIYCVKFYVAPKEMHEPITLTLSTEDMSETITRSVKDYVDYANENKEDYPECIDLINEMYNYGEYSRLYFDGAEITPNPDMSSVNVTIGDKYAHSVSGSISGIRHRGTSLLLESNTTLRHYFALSGDSQITDYTFTINGITIAPVEKDGVYYVEVKNIVAKDLGKLYKAVVSNATESLTITYSPLSYAKLSIEKYAESDPELALLSKALYRYYEAAYKYFGDSNQDIIPDENETDITIW